MSLDITLYNQKTLICDCGKTHILEEEEVFSANITHNLGTMAEKAGIYETVWSPYDLKAGDLIEPLLKGITEMKDKPDYYKKFDAKNGWGTYNDFVPWLDNLLQACIKYPSATIYLSN